MIGRDTMEDWAVQNYYTYYTYNSLYLDDRKDTKDDLVTTFFFQFFSNFSPTKNLR